MGISKPGNLGAMARTASAAGCRALLVADAVVDAFNPNVIHASTGAVFTLPILAGSTADILAFLAAQKSNSLLRWCRLIGRTLRSISPGQPRW
ncbi:MAG: RNA methyltransferase [Phycisphaerales bacterium]|nr:RNA methyltransferase [Phycisphaerales bacterium]